MKHAKPVLFVYGAGSGLGKSTIARALVHWIESTGRSARLFLEESTLDDLAFRGYVAQVQKSNAADVNTLLKSCDLFLIKIRETNANVVVVDSLLPCWDWLYSAGVSDELIFDFTDDLTSLMDAFRPILVLVEGDLERALDRAIEDRGIQWALDLAERRTGYRDRNSLLEYFRALRAGAARAMSCWQFPVVSVDTVTLDIESAVRHTSESLNDWLR